MVGSSLYQVVRESHCFAGILRIGERASVHRVRVRTGPVAVWLQYGEPRLELLADGQALAILRILLHKRTGTSVPVLLHGIRYALEGW